MNLPIAIWMIRSFLLELPKEVLEAARVDGATLRGDAPGDPPDDRPGLAATALICFIFAWNEFFFAVTLTVTQAATVPCSSSASSPARACSGPGSAAACTMAALPVIIAGWVAKWLVRGSSSEPSSSAVTPARSRLDDDDASVGLRAVHD